MPFGVPEILSLGTSLLGGASQSGNQQTGQTQDVPYAANFLNPIWDRAFGIGMNPMPFYPGQTFAPLDTMTTAGMEGAMGYLQNQYSPLNNQYQNYLTQTMNAPANIHTSPAVQGQMAANARQVTDNFLTGVMPKIRTGAQMAGQYGGSRDALATGVGMGRSAEALANANAQTMSNAYGISANMANNAMGQMPNALKGGLLPYATSMDFGRMRQDQAQKAINENMQRWMYPQQSSMDNLAWAVGLMSPFGNSGTRTTTAPGNPLGTALGTYNAVSPIFEGIFGGGSGTAVNNSGVNSFNYVPQGFFGS